MTTPRGPRTKDFGVMDTSLNVNTPAKDPYPSIDQAGVSTDLNKDPMGVVPKGGNKPTGPSGS